MPHFMNLCFTDVVDLGMGGTRTPSTGPQTISCEIFTILSSCPFLLKIEGSDLCFLMSSDPSRLYSCSSSV